MGLLQQVLHVALKGVLIICVVLAILELFRRFRGTARRQSSVAAGLVFLFLALVFHEPWHSPGFAVQRSVWSWALLAITPLCAVCGLWLLSNRPQVREVKETEGK